jgi:hypothetical protein
MPGASEGAGGKRTACRRSEEAVDSLENLAIRGFLREVVSTWIKKPPR